MNEEQLKKYIGQYKKYIESEDYKENNKERMENQKYFAKYTKEKIQDMNLVDMREFLGKMWSMLSWTNNKEHNIDKILETSLDEIKKNLIDLLYSKKTIDERWTNFKVKQMGSAYKSELLSYIYPKQFIIFNSKTAKSLSKLGVNKKYDSNTTAKGYIEICEIAKEIKDKMIECGIKNANMSTVDEMFYFIICPEKDKKKENQNKIENQLVEEKIYGNFLYYGAPGSGKSHRVEEIAEKFDGGYERILFHSEYSYSDFVGQILPNVDKKSRTITYQFKPGPFSKILALALENTSKNYCLVIEEINRGNASAIFGDVFQLMDRIKENDKKYKDENGFRIGDSEYAITNDLITEFLLDDDRDKKQLEKIKSNMRIDGKIYIPHNLSIYATMNSSDQNVFILDSAFKRRWKLKYVPIDLEKIDKNKMIPTNGQDKISWKTFVKVLNEKIPELNNGINGDDKLIGQYFVSNQELQSIDDFSNKIFLYLWNDVAKIDRDKLFRTMYNDEKINTLEKLIKAYKKIGINIFEDKIKEKLLNMEKING